MAFVELEKLRCKKCSRCFFAINANVSTRKDKAFYLGFERCYMMAGKDTVFSKGSKGNTLLLASSLCI